MTALAVRQSTALPIISFARSLVASLAQKDFAGEVNALFEFVRDRVRYVRDPLDAETVQYPLYTLNARAGDCDDKAVLLAALLLALGHKVRFKAVGVNGQSPSHVYVETLLGSDWVALDTTMPVSAGWSPPGISGYEYSPQMGGLGGGFSSLVKKVKKAVKGVGKQVAQLAVPSVAVSKWAADNPAQAITTVAAVAAAAPTGGASLVALAPTLAPAAASFVASQSKPKTSAAPVAAAAPISAPAPVAASLAPNLGVLLAVGAIVGGVYLLRKKGR